MKIVRNTGTERVIDLMRPCLKPGHQLDMVTPTLSLFAFAQVVEEVSGLAKAQLLLPHDGAELGFLGSGEDRAARNQCRLAGLPSVVQTG